MANVALNDFRFGMDRRRPRVAGAPGTLWVGRNIHISRGGDVERCKKFVATFEGVQNTFGLGQINGQIFVFGSANLAGTLPAGLQYQRLQAPDTPDMVGVLFNNTYDRKHYVIAEYADGNIHHFFNGSRVTAWDTFADSNSSYTTLADYLARKISANGAVETVPSGAELFITASQAGVGFTVSATATNVSGGTNDQTITATTLQANVAEVEEVRGTGTVTVLAGTQSPGVNRVEQITVDGVPLMAVPVNWRTSHGATATAIAREITNRTSTHGYSASADGAVVTIMAQPGLGATVNGHVVSAISGGNVVTSTANISGGVTAVTPVKQIVKVSFGGTFEPRDRFDVTVNGTNYRATGRASGYATSVFAYKSRQYLTANVLLQYTKLDDPTDITDSNAASGAGAINIASDQDGSERLLAVTQYQDSVAIFSRKSVSIYQIFANAQNNVFKNSLDNSGTIAPRSVTRFANSDVLYLDEPGIRSLRVREIDGGAYVDDIGSPIDSVVTDWLKSLGEDTIQRAVGVIEPLDGRYMLAVGERIYVLSYFPSSKISAWSYYEPGFTVKDFLRAANRLYARDEDTIYLLGGTAGDEYPGANEQTPKISFPFISAKSPAKFKQWKSVDMACVGTWLVEMLLDPTDENSKVTIGRVTKTTFQLMDIAAIGDAPMFAAELTCNSAGYASFSGFIAHYEGEEEG